MVDRVQPSWSTIIHEWDRFVDWVVRKEGAEEPYVRIYVENAIEEYLSQDDLLETLELVETLLDRCPHSFDRFSDVEYSSPEDAETRPVGVCIRADLVDELRRVADEHTEYRNRYGRLLAKILHHYRMNNRREQINERLQGLIDTMTGNDEEAKTYDPDEQDIHYNDVNVDNLDRRTRKAKCYKICQHLDPDKGAELARREIIAAVQTVTNVSETRAETYIDGVVERLGYTEHPNAPVYVTPDRRAEILNTDEPDTGERPVLYEITQQGFDDLDREGRLMKIRIALARTAARKGRRLYKTDYTFIRNEVFEDSQPSKGYANNAMNAVAEAPGYNLYTEHGKRIKVDHSAINPEISDLLAWERDHQGLGEERSPDPRQTTLDDQPEPEPEPVEVSSDEEALEDVEVEADTFWSQYEQAELENPTATDGGVES